MATKPETDEDKRQRETIEEIATNIAQLSRQVKAIVGGRVRESAIVTLLAFSTKLPRNTVESVLEAITNLEKNTLN